MIEIDGVPAHLIGAMVRRASEHRAKKNEVVHCIGCRKDFSFDAMARPIRYSEIHRGYKGLCLACDQFKKEQEKEKAGRV